jgi:hypothetical protein
MSIARKLAAILRPLFRRQPERDDQWYERCIAGLWCVSRKVGDTIENLYYPPPGYKDSPVLAGFKSQREAREAAAKANAERSRLHDRC